MEAEALKQKIVELENRYWQAMKEKDVDTALEMTDHTCIVAGAQGVAAIDRKMFAGMMNKAKWTLRSYALDDFRVQAIGDDVAIVAYKAHEELDVEGKPVALDVNDSSVWVRRDGRWLCALHTESLPGDPFGRDRANGAKPARS